MILFPNAKINIGLNIIEKRTDGYHNIESIMMPILGLTDVLEIVPADIFGFEQYGQPIPSNGKENIVVQAYELLREKYKLPAVKIYLLKNIPTGAGMGGGSSDAAFCLKGLNEFFYLNISNAELKIMAAKLGADCPFFIDNTPQYATEIGTTLAPYDIDLSRYAICLIKPNIHISTAMAYSGVVAQNSNYELDKIVLRPINEWKNIIQNDFEASLFAKFPVLNTIKNALYTHGAIYAQMSGSGATIYGIFEKKIDINTDAYGEDCFVKWI